MNGITFDTSEKTIQELFNHFTRFTSKKERYLNLSPGFQRKSVWTKSDRNKLIDSVIRNYPIPAIFLYKRKEDGEIIYDVIDGKQRLETFLIFMGMMKGTPIEIKTQLPGSEENIKVNWKLLKKKKKQDLINGYKITTIEVNGDAAEVMELFVRINSTGKALTGAEKRHAKYYNSEFLKASGKLASKYKKYLLSNKILRDGQIARMKHVELMCELMASVQSMDVINKKAALDTLMRPDSISLVQTRKNVNKINSALNKLKLILPNIRETRFAKISDFYSLVILLTKFEDRKLILINKRRNKLAGELLTAFSTAVDKVRQPSDTRKKEPRSDDIYKDYLDTVIHATDSYEQRKKRETILNGLLESLFLRKDKKRLFSAEQRRILWNTTQKRKCKKCGKLLTWDDFSADHIFPFSHGGKTKLKNAAIMHKRCNSQKGNRATK